MRSDQLRPVCPAALPLAGPPDVGPSIVCGVMLRDKELADEVAEGVALPGLITQRTNPTAIYGFCCGGGLPLEDEEDAGPIGRGHYTFCPTWRARKEADFENRERAVEPVARGPGRQLRGEHTPGAVTEEMLGK